MRNCDLPLTGLRHGKVDGFLSEQTEHHLSNPHSVSERFNTIFKMVIGSEMSGHIRGYGLTARDSCGSPGAR